MQIITDNKIIPKLRFGEFNESWQKFKIGEIYSNLRTGMTPSRRVKSYFEGKIPWITSGELKYNIIYETIENITQEAINDTNLKVYPPNTFFIAITGLEAPGTRGKCALNGVPVTTNQSCMAFKENEMVNNRFLFYWYNKFGVPLYFRYAQGTKQQSYNNKIVEKFIIKLPSLTEQQKIASFLSAVDEKLQQLNKKKDLLEEYKKGVMQKIFSQELRFKDTNGNNYPDWEEMMLKEVANFRRGSFPQPYGLRKWYDDDNGFPFVQVFDVADNMLLKSTTKRKISQEAKALSVFVKKGTIVLTIQGSIGRIAITQYDACVDRTLLIFQSFKVPIDVEYFTYIVYLLFDIEKRKAPGGIIKTITKEALSIFKIKLPTLIEQQKIAKFLSSLDSKIDLVSTQIENTKSFKKGLLQQMFV